MIQKIIVVVLAFAANFIIQWYGNFTGKLPIKGTYLGFSYDSLLVRSVITQFEYLWILIIVNIIFTMVFGLGFATFKNFLPLAVIWLAMGPLAALAFNSLVLKQTVSWAAVTGVLLVVLGSILVVAQKEVLAWLGR